MTKIQKIAVPLLVAAAIGGGAIAGYASLAAADTAGALNTQAATSVTTKPAFEATRGGHIGQNGVKEEILTGDLATKATTAALKAVPGGTIERVETDAEG